MKKTISMILAIALFLSMALSLAACGQSKSNGPVIRVGSKDFTENLIVAEMTGWLWRTRDTPWSAS